MTSLPTFARGLKIVRLGILVMLAQLVATIVVQILSFKAGTEGEALDAVRYLGYLMLVSVAAVGAMFIGIARSLPELSRAGMERRTVVAAAIGFAVATVALGWSYYVLSSFIDVMLDHELALDAKLARLETAQARFESMGKVVIAKDLAYGVGLYCLVGTIRASAALNDQLGLRDLAASRGRAVLVMILADLFYQLTYGLGGHVGVIGLVGVLLIAGYWLWCHLKLVSFFEDAAWHMNQPHTLPTATVVARGADEPSSSPARPTAGRSSRPSMPQAPGPRTPPVAPPPVAPPPVAPASTADAPRSSAPIVVLPPRPAAPAPRAASSAEGEPEPGGPRFLR